MREDCRISVEHGLLLPSVHPVFEDREHQRMEERLDYLID